MYRHTGPEAGTPGELRGRTLSITVDQWYSARLQTPSGAQRGSRAVTSRCEWPKGAAPPSTEKGVPRSFSAAHTASCPACPISFVWLNPKIRDFGVAKRPLIQF